MKKIPTLFKREFDNHTVTKCLPELSDESLRWVLDGEGDATIKWDGSCCAIIDGVFYKRYDAKKGKPIPEGAIPCQDKPDEVTGHWPCWVKVDGDNPADKWFIEAFRMSKRQDMLREGDCTYEAVGKHFQGNPYNLSFDCLTPHGMDVVDVHDRSYDGIKSWLETHKDEGIVFWRDGKPRCKIKRTDFGFEWPIKEK